MKIHAQTDNPFRSNVREIMALITPDLLVDPGSMLKKPVHFVVDPAESFGNQFLVSQFGSVVARGERRKAQTNGARHFFTMAMELEDALRAIAPIANGAKDTLRKKWSTDRAFVFTLAEGEVLLGECALPAS